MMNYPNRRIFIESLMAAAANAADECSSDHPQDIAIAMAAAIEAAAPAIHAFWNLSRESNPNESPDEMGG